MSSGDLICVAVVSRGKIVFFGHLIVDGGLIRPSGSTDHESLTNLPQEVRKAIGKIPPKETRSFVIHKSVVWSISIKRYE